MHPVLFKIGPISIQSWGFMLAVAILIAIVGLSRLFKKEGYDSDMVLDMVLLTVVAGLLGGRLAYVLVYQWDWFLNDPLMFFSLTNGGWSGLIWYGGLAGGFIAFSIYIYRKNLSFWKVADMFAPFLALGYALVRVGCFLAGCCYGRITSSLVGVVFHVVDFFPRHPTQLYSSALNLLLFVLLYRFYPHRKFPGQVFLLYLMGYSVYRFTVEFFRDNLIMYFGLSLGQIYTAGLFVLTVIFYFWRANWARKNLFY
ncbi:MAG: prolipoprotein diacylglyceryl transferase [Syntrophomonadaceae bacterium]